MRQDEAYLPDILIASHKTLGYIEDIYSHKFSQNSLLQYAVLYNLEIIGASTRKISECYSKCVRT